MPGYVKAPTDTEQQLSRSPTMLSSFIRWLQIKKYQYEVTFSLYMLTSTEKVVFSRPIPLQSDFRLTFNADTIILILVSFLATAAFYYLPNHLAVVSNRLWYYINGEPLYDTIVNTDGSSIAKETVTMSLKTALSSGTAASAVRNMHEL